LIHRSPSSTTARERDDAQLLVQAERAVSHHARADHARRLVVDTEKPRDDNDVDGASGCGDGGRKIWSLMSRSAVTQRSCAGSARDKSVRARRRALASFERAGEDRGFGLFATGKGLATEGARAALAFVFGQAGLDRIVSIHQVGNDASWRIMEKLGMRLERETVDPSCAGRCGSTRSLDRLGSRGVCQESNPSPHPTSLGRDLSAQ
jgi:Acetyltransferase (GNAT) domain